MSLARAVVAALLSIGVAHADIGTQTVSSPVSSSDVSHDALMHQNTQEAQARHWGLSMTEWSRYQELMAGPRGIWSPGLDPITVLGIAARSDEERMRYARLLMETERHRVEQELAFQRAYDQAWRDYHPDLQPVVTFFSDPAASTSPVLMSRLERVSVVTATQGCQRCDQFITSLIEQGANMDVFVTDAESDDHIRQWAARIGVPIDRVRSRNITLNHYSGLPVSHDLLPIWEQE